MPWQRQVVDVALELDGEGLPVYRQVGLLVPRQNGKTTLILAWEIMRALLWGGRQRILYSAQSGWDAYKKIINDQVPMIEESELGPAFLRPLRGVGNTALLWRGGSRIELVSNSKKAGHGGTIDMAVLDEAFADQDNRRELALSPAGITKMDYQRIVTSTAGEESSVFLWDKVTRGRAAVERGECEDICYFEWSADDGADADDPSSWWSCMPALGHTISERAIRSERKSMQDGEFRRSFLNQWTVASERVIPFEAWERRVVSAVRDGEWGPVVFGVDVNAERSHAAVAVSDGVRCALVEYRPGTAWVADRVAELVAKWDGRVVIDKYGPAASVVEADIEFGVQDVAQACASFFDDVIGGGGGAVVVQRSPELDAAVAGAVKRQSGDVWLWARRGLTDVSPLIAVTLAKWAAVQQAGPSVYEQRGMVAV